MSDSASIMPEHPPVTDWVNDFDHTNPTWTENPFPIWEKLRAASPVVHTERFLVFVLPSKDSLAPARLGITVSRKVGGAVVRNRIKRLLREAFRRRKERRGQELLRRNEHGRAEGQLSLSSPA